MIFKQRRLSRLLTKIMSITGVAGLAGAGYMLFEAQWLKLRRRRLELAALPAALDGFKILHVSDLHAGAPGPGIRAIRKFVAGASAAGADMIVFTGDMTDKKRDLAPYLDLLAQVDAPLGKFAVLGNHDHGLRKTFFSDMGRRLTGRGGLGRFEIASEDISQTVALNRKLLAQADIRLLENECARIPFLGEELQLCGVDDFHYGYADLPLIDSQLDRSAGLRILLSHSPDIMQLLPEGDFHLVLSGHTHGGQICLPHPTRGKMLLSSSGSNYGSGLYRLPGVILHVSPGVGTTLLPFRLLSRPEITLLELVRGQGPASDHPAGP